MALEADWDVSIVRISDEIVSIMFRTSEEYRRFYQHSLARANPGSLFEADVKDMHGDARSAGGITQLRLSSGFDVGNTLAKVLGLRDL